MIKKNKKNSKNTSQDSILSWCKAHGFSSVSSDCIAEAKKMASKMSNKKLMMMANSAQKSRM